MQAFFLEPAKLWHNLFGEHGHVLLREVVGERAELEQPGHGPEPQLGVGGADPLGHGRRAPHDDVPLLGELLEGPTPLTHGLGYARRVLLPLALWELPSPRAFALSPELHKLRGACASGLSPAYRRLGRETRSSSEVLAMRSCGATVNSRRYFELLQVVAAVLLSS